LNFLKRENLRFSYAPEYWNGARLTFDNKEDCIFTQPYNDRYPLYTVMADASSKPAFVLDGKYIESFESMFQALGGSYKKKLFAFFPGIKGYAVYYGFRPPEKQAAEILPVKWKGTSNFNPEAAGRAFDRNLSTGWSSSSPQKAGMYYQIDLGTVHKINRLVLLTGKGKEREFPSNYRLEVSINEKDWLAVTAVNNNWAYLYWSLDRPFWKFRDGRLEIRGNSQDARFIRITLTGSSPRPWTIGEILAYEEAELVRPEGFPMVEFLAFLTEHKIRSVYADIGLSARITFLTQGKIACLQDDYHLTNIMDFPTKRYNEAFPFFNRMEKKVDFTLFPAFVVKKENSPAFEQTLQKMNGACRVRDLGDYRIYSHFKLPEKPSLIDLKGSSTAYYWNGTHLFLIDSSPGVRK
jgi:hypothetical protein